MRVICKYKRNNSVQNKVRITFSADSRFHAVSYCYRKESGSSGLEEKYKEVIHLREIGRFGEGGSEGGG